MSWLVMLRPTRDRLRNEGKLVVAGPSIVAGDSFGIGVLDVDGEDEVRAIVAADPAVESGAMTAEIRPLSIAVR